MIRHSLIEILSDRVKLFENLGKATALPACLIIDYAPALH